MNKVPWSPYASIYDPVKVGSIDGTDTDPHDHGVVRAMNVVYEPKKFESDPKKTLFIGRLEPSVTEEDLNSLFRKYGKLREVCLIRDIVTGFSKRYAFVTFKHSDDARAARRETNRLVFKGKEILVDFECARTLPGWKPRRLGGGFGGRKESGQLRFGCADRPWKRPIAMDQRREDRHSDRNLRRDRSKEYDTKDKRSHP